MAKARLSAEVLLVVALAALFVGRSFLPAWRSLNTDFPNYYVAARLYSQGVSLTRVYDWIWFQRQKDHLGMERRIVGFVPFTLFSAMPIVPLASMPSLEAKRYWLVINLLLLALTVLLLHKMTRLGGLRTAILVLLAIEPLHTQFLYGQLHVLVLLLTVAALWLYLKDWPIAAGGTLALASAFKIYPILFVFYFLRKKQWRAVMGLTCGSLLLAAIATVLFGMDVNLEYAKQILPRIARGEGLDPYNLNWNSFSALFHRLFVFEPQLNPHPLISMPLAYAVLQPLTQGLLFIPLLWLLAPQRATAERETLEYGTFVVALLLLSTHPASYHYVLLIVCAVLVTDRLLRSRRTWEAMLVVVLYTLACLPTQRISEAVGGLAGLTSSSRLVFTTGLFLALLTMLTLASSETWRDRFRSRSSLVFVPLFLVGVSAAALDHYRHLRDVPYAARITPGPESLLVAQPTVSETRIAFTKLQPPGYAIGSISGNRMSSFGARPDLFHPAVLPHSSQALVELAAAKSRIVRIDLDEEPPSGEGLPVEVEDGESPSISPDGRWLLFIREVRGRGSLWIKGLQGQPTESGGGELKLVGAEYDVLEATFDPDGAEIVFAAQPRGTPALFTMERSSSRISQSSPGSASRYPAISPDGRWLTYSRLNGQNWQIWLRARDSDTSEERQLTQGDCNSISPAWTADSKELLYTTDCGRGVGMTALARIRAVQ